MKESESVIRLHAELVRRARQRGKTLTEYIEDILEREVAYPPLEDVLARIEAREPVPLSRPAAEIIKAERARRTR